MLLEDPEEPLDIFSMLLHESACEVSKRAFLKGNPNHSQPQTQIQIFTCFSKRTVNRRPFFTNCNSDSASQQQLLP
eukprot:g3336.t1